MNYSQGSACFFLIRRVFLFYVSSLDPNAPNQLGVCDSYGLFWLTKLNLDCPRLAAHTTLLLHHWSDGQIGEPVHTQWLSFYFLAARQGEVLFCQSGGTQILFFKLPMSQAHSINQVFHFGSHKGTWQCKFLTTMIKIAN